MQHQLKIKINVNNNRLQIVLDDLHTQKFTFLSSSSYLAISFNG